MAKKKAKQQPDPNDKAQPYKPKRIKYNRLEDDEIVDAELEVRDMLMRGCMNDEIYKMLSERAIKGEAARTIIRRTYSQLGYVSSDTPQAVMYNRRVQAIRYNRVIEDLLDCDEPDYNLLLKWMSQVDEIFIKGPIKRTGAPILLNGNLHIGDKNSTTTIDAGNKVPDLPEPVIDATYIEDLKKSGFKLPPGVEEAFRDSAVIEGERTTVVVSEEEADKFIKETADGDGGGDETGSASEET